jgi:phosphosulfolactate synthase
MLKDRRNFCAFCCLGALSGRLLDELTAVVRNSKPRDTGLTIAYDSFGPVEDGLLEQTSEYMDLVKFGLSTPLLVEKSKLVEKISRYHDLGVKVVSGGTLIEIAVQRNIIPQVLERLRALGFDVVEISESAGAMQLETKRQILDEISKLSLDYIFEVGWKDSRREKSSASMISRVQEAFELKSEKVIVELREEDGVSGPYTSREGMPWEMLNEIAGRFGPPNLIFKATQAPQRTALILEFGPSVNLAGVSINEILTLEMQRLGLTAETLGLSRPVQDVEGSPASKFVYHLIRAEHPIDQTTLIARSGLPKRTVQGALNYLVNKGLVRTVSEPSDMRRHKYALS